MIILYFVSSEFLSCRLFRVIKSSIYNCLYGFLMEFLFKSRRSLIIPMSQGELCFIVVATAMVLEPQRLVIVSTYFYGAEGSFYSFYFRNTFFDEVPVSSSFRLIKKRIYLRVMCIVIDWSWLRYISTRSPILLHFFFF